MLTATQKATNSKVEAAFVRRTDAPFLCPACKKLVILKQGRMTTHHFAHKPHSTCTYGSGESEQHRRAKHEIAASLRAAGIQGVEIEKDFRKVRADVYCLWRGRQLAFEVQISRLTMDQIYERTAAYQKLGIAVMWIVPWSERLTDKYAPKQYEQWLHALNFGRVYYWQGGLNFVAVHYGKYMLYKEDWNGYGGFQYASKRYRWPEPLSEQLNFLNDFQYCEREQGNFGKLTLPKATIVQDNRPTWWRN